MSRSCLALLENDSPTKTKDKPLSLMSLLNAAEIARSEGKSKDKPRKTTMSQLNSAEITESNLNSNQANLTHSNPFDGTLPQSQQSDTSTDSNERLEERTKLHTQITELSPDPQLKLSTESTNESLAEERSTIRNKVAMDGTRVHSKLERRATRSKLKKEKTESGGLSLLANNTKEFLKSKHTIASCDLNNRIYNNR